MFRSQTSPVCAHAHTLFSSVKPESLRFLVSGLSEVRNLVPSVFSFSNMAVKQTGLDAVRRASWGKNQKRLICIRPKFVHISRYALKIPGEIVWYGHYRSSSAFKRHNMRCSFEIFLRKGGRNRRLLLASQNCYFLCRRDNFKDRNNAVRVNTSFLHVLKVLDFQGLPPELHKVLRYTYFQYIVIRQSLTIILPLINFGDDTFTIRVITGKWCRKGSLQHHHICYNKTCGRTTGIWSSPAGRFLHVF